MMDPAVCNFFSIGRGITSGSTEALAYSLQGEMPRLEISRHPLPTVVTFVSDAYHIYYFDPQLQISSSKIEKLDYRRADMLRTETCSRRRMLIIHRSSTCEHGLLLHGGLHGTSIMVRLRLLLFPKGGLLFVNLKV